MSAKRYQRLYTKLLCLYPKTFRYRFAEGMAQTFNDLLREPRNASTGLLGLVLRIYVDTCAGIARENVRSMTPAMKKLGMPLLVVLASTAILAAVYFANGADDPWYYVTAWIIVLASTIPYSTTKGRDER